MDLSYNLSLVIVVAIIGGGFVFFVLFSYHFLQSFEGMKGRWTAALTNLLAPFSDSSPSIFTSKGDCHRRRSFVYLILFLLCLAVLFGFRAIVELA